MPTSDIEFLVAPTETVRIQVEPVQSLLHSLMLLVKAEHLSGLSDWAAETAAAMTPAEHERHYLVVIGLHYAVMPDQSWNSFPAYLDYLDQVDPVVLRDKILDTYMSFPVQDGAAPTPALSRAELLADIDQYIAYLQARFPEAVINEPVERQAFTYLNDPPAMRRLIVDHLRHMWETYLAAEWDRTAQMLYDSVAAFQQLDLRGLSRKEIAELVVGRPLDAWMCTKMEEMEHFVLAPNPHVGPYMGRFMRGQTMGILFRARIPEGVQFDAPDLSRSEILVRLNALADDTRLRILKYIAANGEQSSQSIMNELELSQSAASRHLNQLAAIGYLTARRCDGAKCFTLDRERVDDTFRAVLAYLD